MGNFPGPWNPAYLANYSVTPTSGNNSSFGPTPVGTIVAYGVVVQEDMVLYAEIRLPPHPNGIIIPVLLTGGQTGYLPTNIAPPTNPAWYPSPYNIIPQPSSRLLTIKPLLALLICGSVVDALVDLVADTAEKLVTLPIDISIEDMDFQN